MSALLRECLRTPTLYEETAQLFWCDPDVSPQLLAAHLDADNPMASRPPHFIEASAEWIASVAPVGRYPRICDLGCGPGLYAERMARRGYRVTGVDISPMAIEYARASAARNGLAIDYAVCDYVDLRAEHSADMAILAYCDYGALPEKSRGKLMRNVKGLLRPGGIFVLDVFSARHYENARELRSWDVASSGGLWTAEPHVCLHERKKYRNHVLLDRYIVQTSSKVKAYNIWTTCFGPESLAREAANAGFTVIDITGSIAGDALDPAGDTICVVLRGNEQ